MCRLVIIATIFSLVILQNFICIEQITKLRAFFFQICLSNCVMGQDVQNMASDGMQQAADMGSAGAQQAADMGSAVAQPIKAAAQNMGSAMPYTKVMRNMLGIPLQGVGTMVSKLGNMVTG